MKMDNIGLRFLEYAKEIPHGIRQLATHVWLDDEALAAHLLTQWAKSSDRIDARIVALLALQTAHLHDERFCAAHFHAIDNMRNLHMVCKNLQQRCSGLCAVTDIEDESRQLSV